MVQLTFNRGTSTSVDDVTFYIVDGAGKTISNASATVTVKKGTNDVALRAKQGTYTEDILAPNSNTSGATEGSPIELTFTISNLPNGFSFNRVGLDIHALDGSNRYQSQTANGGDADRDIYVEIQQNGNSFASLQDIAINVKSPYTDREAVDDRNKHYIWPADATESVTVSGDLTLTLKIWKGTQNGGCFFGLSSITLSKNTVKLNAATGLADGTIGTYSAPYPTTVPTGVKAYYLAQEVADNVAHLAPLAEAGGVIPANTGVVLYSEAGMAEAVMAFAQNGMATAATAGNKLSNTSSAAHTCETTDYILGKKDDLVAFYQATGTLGMFKAYLPLSSGASAVKMSFDGEVTGIGSLETAQPAESVVFDLSGRRVNKAQKGIYIVNGKKVYVK